MENRNNIFAEGRVLPLVEEFYTIQGEGYHSGKPAYFIRLGGCDVGCRWCDTKFSWDPDIHPAVETDSIIDHALANPARAVVVTGGEPLMYNLNYLCKILKDKGFTLYLETSGAYPLSGSWDWICLSPKQTSPPLTPLYQVAHELKVIIQTVDDFPWAEENAKKVNGNCILYLQPEWSRYYKMIHSVVDYVKANPKWNVSLQAHKFMHIP